MRSKRVMALVLSLTVIMSSSLCVSAAGSGYGSGYGTTSANEKSVVANQEPGSDQQASVSSVPKNVVKRGNGTVIQSTVAGRYTSRKFAGTAVSSAKSNVNAALGVQSGETSWISISDSTCGEKAMKTVTDVSDSMGAKVAGILDIYGSKITKAGKRTDIKHPAAAIEYTVGIPASMKAPAGYQIAVLRVYGENGIGKADLLKDMDSDPDTVTFSSDKFGVFAFVHIKSL